MNYKVVWKERGGVFGEEFEKYLKKEVYSNVMIYTEEKACPIMAHSLILASLGGHLATLLKDQDKRNFQNHKIIIPNVSRQCLMEALLQVYSGSLTMKSIKMLEETGILNMSRNIVVKSEVTEKLDVQDGESNAKMESEELEELVDPCLVPEMANHDDDLEDSTPTARIIPNVDVPLSKHSRKNTLAVQNYGEMNHKPLKIEVPYVEEHLKEKDCGCNIMFKSRINKLIHLRLEHSELPSFPCPTSKKCKKYIFSSKNSLHKHLKKKHNHSCDESCQLNSEVADELSALKAKKRKYVKKKSEEGCFCEVCGKQFKNFTNMNAHKISSHDPNQTWPCPDCGKVFQHSNNLRIHKNQMHSTEKFLCQTCATEFKSRKNLRNHIYSNHTPEDKKKHVCTMCPKPKGFATKGKLDMHKSSVHLKNTPYACRYECGRAYNDGSNRNAHEKKTHGSLHISALMSLQERNCLPEALPGLPQILKA